MGDIVFQKVVRTNESALGGGVRVMVVAPWSTDALLRFFPFLTLVRVMNHSTAQPEQQSGTRRDLGGRTCAFIYNDGGSEEILELVLIEDSRKYKHKCKFIHPALI